jgi:hypothetical protein
MADYYLVLNQIFTAATYINVNWVVKGTKCSLPVVRLESKIKMPLGNALSKASQR